MVLESQEPSILGPVSPHSAAEMDICRIVEFRTGHFTHPNSNQSKTVQKGLPHPAIPIWCK